MTLREGWPRSISQAEIRTTHVFKEDLENTTCLLIDETRDTLDTATTSETTDGLSWITTVTKGAKGGGTALRSVVRDKAR